MATNREILGPDALVPKTEEQKHGLERTAFVTDRALEFFTDSELTTQVGYGRNMWPVVLVKELVDNALDACEMHGVEAPVIRVTLKDHSITIKDNGPGIPADTIQKSLDYTIRVSDKKGYISPTRGALGNALKGAWAMPFVAIGGKAGLVAEVQARGLRHRISISLDSIGQKLNIDRRITKSTVQSGTSITIHWRGIASYGIEDPNQELYRDQPFQEALPDLIISYCAMNPHVSFIFNGVDFNRPTEPFAVPKWPSNRETSAHWYRAEDLLALITAYVGNDADRYVRDFIGEFAGLRRTPIKAAVMKRARIKEGTRLSELRNGDSIDLSIVTRLLAAMKERSNNIKPSRLGVIGRNAFIKAFNRLGGTGVMKYYRSARHDDGDELPYVIEVGFGIGSTDFGRKLVIGLNGTPIFTSPFEDILGKLLLHDYEDIIIFIHITKPRFSFTDHGKGQVETSRELDDDIEHSLVHVAKDYIAEKRRVRANKLSAAQSLKLSLNEAKQDLKIRIKEAAYEVMEEAYIKAAKDETTGKLLPVSARQVMYAARPLVLAKTNGKCWDNSAYFTQTLLPDYQEERPDETAKWNVVYDARGHLLEPHVYKQIALGTLEVRSYVRQWEAAAAKALGITIDEHYPTAGPKNRYKFALFIEKEGFDPLIAASDLTRRYDLAVFSSKGMSTTATRELVDALARLEVTVLIAHDFDLPGLTISHTLSHDGRRYTFTNSPKVIDIGLRLADVKRMGLQSEPVEYTQIKDPRAKFRDQGYDATEAELKFLVTNEINQGKRGKGVVHWVGKRVELNAMTSGQFVGWLEGKLIEHKVTKVIPGEVTLVEAWRRGQLVTSIKRSIKVLTEAAAKNPPKPPANLSRWVHAELRKNPYKSWDEVLVPQVEE